MFSTGELHTIFSLICKLILRAEECWSSFFFVCGLAVSGLVHAEWMQLANVSKWPLSCSANYPDAYIVEGKQLRIQVGGPSLSDWAKFK